MRDLPDDRTPPAGDRTGLDSRLRAPTVHVDPPGGTLRPKFGRFEVES